MTMPVSAKESLRAIKIVFYTLFAGVILFASVIFIVSRVQGPLLKDKSLNTIFLVGAAFLGAACLGLSNFLSRKRISAARSSTSLVQKLDVYRAALILYMAILEAAAIFSIITFYLTGEYFLLGI